jgi:hypothetical protein
MLCEFRFHFQGEWVGMGLVLGTLMVMVIVIVLWMNGGWEGSGEGGASRQDMSD